MSKTLIAYFSNSGHTKRIAEELKNILNADIFEIKAKIPYTSDDLNWENPRSRTSIEMNDKNSRPEIKEKISNLNDYDTIFLGTPIWWDRNPSIIDTFLDENNLEGKNIYLFSTSGSSSITNTLNYLKNERKNLKFIAARRFSNYENAQNIQKWVDEIN